MMRAKKSADGIRPKAVSVPSRIPPKEEPAPPAEPVLSIRDPEMRRPQPEAVVFVGAEERIVSAPRRWGRWGALAGLVAAAVLLALVSFSFARLTVVAKPRVEEVAIEGILVRFDTSVSRTLHSQKVVPAERLSFSRAVTKEFPATGRARVEERARGKARIYNGFSSSPQPLVAETRFSTDSGVVYRIKKAAVIPGAKISEGKIVPESVEAELTADLPGEESNFAGEVRLKIPGLRGSPRYDGFYALAPQGFGGGFRGEATVVSKEDLKAAEESATKAVFEELRQEMQGKIPAGFKFIEALREIEIKKITAPSAGERKERLAVEAQAAGNALVFREEDVMALLGSAALEDAKDRELVDGSGRFSYAVRSIDFTKGRADVTIAGSLKIKSRIPETELAELLKGKKEGSVIEALKGRGELVSFNLAFFPPWRSSAPRDPSKIRFRVEGP